MDNIEEILEFHCPRFNDLPKVPLYKDQVIMYIENALNIINVNSEEKFLTPTMLNNYVKQKVVYPPKDKKYNEKHLAYLIVVCILKQVYTLTEICELIKIQIATCPIEQAYDCFCIELETSLRSVFITRKFSASSASIKNAYESEIIRSAARSFAHKIFIQKYLRDRE
ncbi:DUF1836 domain-containing protein [Clostridium gasigenes]|uniref:DUF1836 domain-containing protein n=1 Tax=Clostridium gasigenes TaxID=94869 RepID=UPI001438373C|nr:DUF1836 domain-containing protein [Clostridium gasigenes]NKF05816.1 DUF1836 domain-containing protein [Clostridium gasigenes]QSW19451.1 DUF1836 domain-containing protein [Clostridium gasigenes]